MPGSVISGWGAALPPRVLTNADFERRLDTSDAWIVERTGIRERHVGGTTTGLAVEAGRRALERAGMEPSAVELLMVSTNTPDRAVPATAPVVQHELGLSCGAMDLNSGCSGFVYGAVLADALVKNGTERVLLIASDTVSRIVDPDDRAIVILFGDAAGAAVIEASSGPSSILGYDLGADGSAADILCREHGQPLYMNGHEVYRRAVRATVSSARSALERAKVDVGEIALFVPHQANIRIMEAVAGRLGFAPDRMMAVLDHTGNTSSASIPVALAEAADGGRLRSGDLVLAAGFGAGMTWASMVIRWGAPQ